MTLALDDECPHHTTIFKWYKEFQRGNFNWKVLRGFTLFYKEQSRYVNTIETSEETYGDEPIKFQNYVWIFKDEDAPMKRNNTCSFQNKGQLYNLSY